MRRHPIVLTALLAAGAVGAGESLPEDAISGAKRDFDGMNEAVREGALPPDASAPRVTLPGLRLERPAVPPASGATASPAEKAPDKKRPDNWLVDAMTADGPSGRNRIRSREPHRARSRLDSTDAEAMVGKDVAAEEARAEKGSGADEIDVARESSDVLINPLTGYLESWMTARDYALLKPALTDASDAGLSTVTAGAILSASSGELPDNGGRFVWPGPLSRGVLPAPAPRDNPFLASSTILALPPLGPNPSTGPSAAKDYPVPDRPGPPPTHAPDDRPAARIPDFVRPATDEKYFPQLKRF